MKKLKLYYIVPIVLALFVSGLLIGFLLPKAHWIITFIICTLCLIIVGVGFRIITAQRIQIIRNQLYQILETLETFDVDEPKKIAFVNSPFPIFNELNEYLIELIDRVRSNYHANKQFTQNASHELQTPLAIIKGHIEILLQSPNIGEKEMNSLSILLQNTNRLSKLNKALILLSKIEHQRFNDTEAINFIELTEEIIENFEDMVAVQGLRIEKQYKTPFIIEMSRTLAEIMVTNLLQNAIRHNIKNGSIFINISETEYSINNHGPFLELNPKQLFKRFKRESSVEESLGLGLSIIKRICDQSSLGVDYQYSESLHRLCLTHQGNSSN